MTKQRICIVGVSGKLGQLMARHALDRGYDVVGVCRPQSVAKLTDLADRIRVLPGATDDPAVIARAVAGCSGVLTVLVPWGVRHYSSGTAQAVLDHADAGARIVFSCGWHVRHGDGDHYRRMTLIGNAVVGWIARALRVIDVDDQLEAARRIFASDRRWTLVRASDLEDGESEGLPIWRRHVGDPALASNRTRRTDFALFMLEALRDDALVHEAPAIVGRLTPSALAHTPSQTEPADGQIPWPRAGPGDLSTCQTKRFRTLRTGPFHWMT
ncbi:MULTISPECIES: NAD(P)-dependent oxidoreductase [Bacteria]|uniref:NAD(P)-dependent oxidoreductase n=1 Tax=Bacteria TaxID=2 RepID=UPI003C7C86CA